MISPRSEPVGQSGAIPALVQYSIVTFAWTWTIWWIAVFAGRTSIETPIPLLFALGGLGPVVGAGFVIRGTDQGYRREFVRRLWDPRRISGVWWLALAAVAIVPALAAYLMATAAGRPPPGESTITLGTVAFILGFAFAAGAVEEPGWRGVALDLLQTQTSSMVTATLIGVLWALWHLPLFFIEGTYQHDLGLWSARFWHFNVALVLLSILYVWICNGTRGSILAAILVHAGTNISGSLIPQDALTDMFRSLIFLFAVIIVAWFTRGDLLLHNGRVRGAPNIGMTTRLRGPNKKDAR